MDFIATQRPLLMSFLISIVLIDSKNKTFGQTPAQIYEYSIRFFAVRNAIVQLIALVFDATTAIRTKTNKIE